MGSAGEGREGTATREVEVVVLMVDLSGYSALTDMHGDLEAAKVVVRFAELARAALVPGAWIVERVGDELVIAAPDVASALTVAARLRGAVRAEPLFPEVRMALHAGRVLEHEGRFIGGALNLTARVAAHAVAGQVLCTEAVAATAARLTGVSARSLGEVRFKNLADPVAVFELAFAGGPAPAESVDPVCRMQVEEAAARLVHGGVAYVFCSAQCAARFAERPDAYLR